MYQTLLSLLPAVALVSALPTAESPPAAPRGISFPLYHHEPYAARGLNKRSGASAEANLAHGRNQASYLRNKYHSNTNNNANPSDHANEKRQLAPMTVVGGDTYWYAPVGFGTPAQPLALVLDTGSTDLWVASDACTASACDSLPKFVTGNSSTLEVSDQPFSIRYGSGATVGNLVADRVELAGYAVENLTFALATDLARGTLSAPAAGLMGMALQQLSSVSATPFWQVLAKQNVLPDPVFTFQLARNERARSATNQSPGGIFTLGTIDKNQYSGDIHWVNMPDDMVRVGYWAITMDRMEFEGGEVESSSNNYNAAIDTGTTLIAVPSSLASSLYSKIPNAHQLDGDDGMYVFPCNQEVKVSLVFDGVPYEIRPDDFNHGTIDILGRECIGAVFAMETNSPTPAIIAGDALLKSYFTAYTTEPQPRIGFASLKTEGEAQTLSSTASVHTDTGIYGPATLSVSSHSSQLQRRPPPATGTGIYYGTALPAPVATASEGVHNQSSNGQLASNNNVSGSAKHAAPVLLSFVATLVLGAVLV